MDEDKQDKAGLSPGGDANKRPPPTIELTASEVSESPSAPDADAGASKPDHTEPSSDAPAESGVASSPKPSRTLSALLSVFAGAVAALLVIGAATFAGWPPKPESVSTAPLAAGIAANKADITTLGTRVAKVESDVAKPAPRPIADPAIVARIDAVEKSLASLRGDLAAVRGQNEKAAAAISEIKSASPQGVMTGEARASTVDTSAIEERIAKIERATAALSAAAAAPPPTPQPPAEDPKVRRLNALVHLDKAVNRGLPYATELAAARAAAGDADVLRALDGFATAGLPTDDALSKELLALLPQLAPKPEAQPAPSGIVERLQQSFAKLVRIQRTDALASGPTGIIARATAAAQRNDANEAKRELLQLPPSDRVPARPWIAKVEGRDKARAAVEQFTMDTLTAISKSAQ